GPRSNPVVVSGSQEAPTPPTLVNQRRPVDNTPGTGVPPNTVYMARSNGTATATKDSTATASMVPSRLTVPVGTTVTFTNPGDATFGVAGSGNLLEHCATQFFEGLFNFRLQPGQSAQYTFDREGQYFYNDCTDPRPSGKVVVTLAAQDMPGAATIFPSQLDLRPPTGIFTGVNGTVTVSMTVPADYVLDTRRNSEANCRLLEDTASCVTLTTPLTTAMIVANFAAQSGNLVKANFNKADIDNNVPAGTSVPLTFTANFMNDGVQKKVTSTVHGQVVT